MKFADLVIGTEYGVIPSWEYSSRNKKDPATVTRRNVAKAVLVSLDKYEYLVYRAESADNSNFKLAPKGSRAVGYLVKSRDWTDALNPDREIFWIARPQDIIDEYVDLEARWVVQEREEKLREEEQRKAREEEERKEREEHAKQQRIVDSCTKALVAFIGAEQVKKNVRTEVNRRYIHGEYRTEATFQFNSVAMQLLIEKILQVQDEVA